VPSGRRGARGGPHRQLDLFAPAPDGVGSAPGPAGAAGDPAAGSGPVTVLEGVIDLVFREEGGWVVVDYKTDVGTDPSFGMRLEGYRRQVDLYAHAWATLTGEPVRERVLFFTAQDRVERW